MCLPHRISAHPLRLCVGLSLFLVASACTQPHAQQSPKPAPPPLEFLGEWGKKGDGPGELSYPSSIAVDAVGNAYVTDLGSGFVHKFTLRGEPLFSFQESVLKCPGGIAVDPGGAIFVADPGRGNVVIFYPNGDRLRTIHIASPRKCAEPLAISVDAEGNLFFADPGRHAIRKFSPRGRLLQSWGGAKKGSNAIGDPADVVADGDGFLYVSDTTSRQLQKYGPDGNLVASLSVPPSEPAPIVLAGLTLSPKYVFVADPRQHRIYVWSKEGPFLHSHDLAARLHTAEPTPLDLATTPRGELLVLDPKGPRVLRFRINF